MRKEAKMRNIKEIIIHCTATPRGRNVTVDEIRACHVKQNGWSDIGYHYIIYIDGSVHRGRAEEQVGAHCRGHNARSIGIAYVGGVEAEGKPADTRTEAQKASLKSLVKLLLKKYPGATVHGHNEFASKACPSFNVKAEFSFVKTIVIIALMMTMIACGSVKKSVVAKTDTAERVDVVSSEHRVEKIDISEFTDMVMTIDSVEVEHIDVDSRVTKLKSGPITIKLKRETASRTVETEERETKFDKDCHASTVSQEKTDIENRGQKMWCILILIAILAVYIAKIVKK